MAGLVALISIPISITLGLWAAMHPGTRLDRMVTFGTLSTISVPEFFIATIMVLIFAVKLKWLPATFNSMDAESFWVFLKGIAMPLITLVIVVSAQMIRMTRAGILNVMSSPYIEMARLKGVPQSRVITRHALPNALAPVLVAIAFGVAGAILTESSLSFLGIGVEPGVMTWGKLLTSARADFSAWWLAIIPGFAIFITVTIYNLIGEGLTDALDPKMKQ